MVKMHCLQCGKSCKEKIVKHKKNYFHLSCFKCSKCSVCLKLEGFYEDEAGKLYCEADYMRLFKKHCRECGEAVEGEVLVALQSVFHKECFACSLCRRLFEEGNRVTVVGEEHLCSHCFEGDEPAEGATTENPTLGGCEATQETATSKPAVKDTPPNYGYFYKHSYLWHDERPIRRAVSINASEPSPKHYHRPVNFSYSQVLRDFVRLPKKESSIYLSTMDRDFDDKDGRANGRLITKRGGGVDEVVVGMNNKEAVKLARLPDGRLKVKLVVDDCKDVLEKGDVENKEKSSDECEGDEEEDNADDEVERDNITGLKKLKVNPALRIYGGCHLTSELADFFKQTVPPKVYSYEELKLSNFKLPFGVERDTIEKHLAEGEFERLFRMDRSRYYELPEWRRNDMKRRLQLY